MLLKEKQAGEKGIWPENQMKKRRTKKWYFILVFTALICGYCFFLTSMLWMPTGGKGTTFTELNEPLEWSEGRKITLIRWDYSKEQKLMEVELEIENTSFDGVNTYEYGAADRNRGDLEITPVLQEPDWVILQIQDIPDKFTDVVAHVIHPETGDYFSVYTNIDDVNKVAQIEPKDRNGYLEARYAAEIQGYQEKIAGLQEEIRKAQESISSIGQEKQDLEAKKEYQTESEQEETQNAIADADSRVSELQDEIVESNIEIQEYQAKIVNAEKKKGSLQ